jgi:hypothetical protein
MGTNLQLGKWNDFFSSIVQKDDSDQLEAVQPTSNKFLSRFHLVRMIKLLVIGDQFNL